jgi:hypothetical protein
VTILARILALQSATAVPPHARQDEVIVAQLVGMLPELIADARRLDWLQEHAASVSGPDIPITRYYLPSPIEGEDLRAAIDAARRQR